MSKNYHETKPQGAKNNLIYLTDKLSDQVATFTPYVPISHPFVERLIGTIRRELLDRSLFWNSFDLKRKLDNYQFYFNEKRSHQSLDALTPTQRSENFHPNLLNIKKYD